MARSREPTFAVQLLRPLARFVQAAPQRLPHELSTRIAQSVAREERVPVAPGLELIKAVAAACGDADFGLRIALYAELGDFAVLEQVASSAATWREANIMVCRYAHVLNEAADYRLEICE